MGGRTFSWQLLERDAQSVMVTVRLEWLCSMTGEAL